MQNPKAVETSKPQPAKTVDGAMDAKHTNGDKAAHPDPATTNLEHDASNRLDKARTAKKTHQQ